MGNPRTINGLAAVTPNNSADLPEGTCRGIYVGVSGDLAVVSESGSEVTLTALAAGVLHPISITRVKSTGTTATDIVALY